MSRLPIRLRVTLAFAGVMALVLGGTGLFLYLRLGAELDAGIERTLRARAAQIEATAGRGLVAPSTGGIVEDDESVAQILDAAGNVVERAGAVGREPLLSAAERARAGRETFTVDRPDAIDGDDPARLLATARGDGHVVVVGESLEERDDAVAGLGALLLTGGPVALLLAALAGYGATAAALRPVERMRARAAAISSAGPGARLPLGPADDEVGRLGATLNAMLARLETAFDRERAFVADASHELRTPLAVLRAELELALRRGRTREELELALRSAAQETERLIRLAEDLLVIARLDQGRLPVRLQPVDAAQLLGAVAERHDVTVRDPGELRLDADPERLEQALGNLVDNARRHGGGVVELSAEEVAGAVELHVRDDGPGFPAGFTDLAFERFTRGDPAREGGGAGLGLAIVAAIAAAHGGEAGARNRPEGGADAWIRLPAPAASRVERTPEAAEA